MSDVKIRSLTASDTQTIYTPFAQTGRAFQTVVVRTAVAPRGAVSSIVGAIHTVLPDQPVHVPQRGAEVNDIVNMATIAVVDAQETAD